MSTQLDLITIGRVSVDLYGEQVGSRLEDVSTLAKGVGGCPANIAIGVARLGLKSGLISRVGDEPMGRFVLEQLSREGVSTRGVTVDPERLTSLVLLAIRSESSFPLVFYRDNCADSALSEADIDASYIASANAILVTGTHFSRAASAAAQAAAMAIARRANRKIILDVDYRPNLWGIGGHGAGESRYARSGRVTAALTPHLSLCDLIVGTEEELHIAGGDEDTLQACRNIRKLSKAVIVCKRGAMGCVVISGDIPNSLEDGIVGHGMPVKVYNVLGAGDAFLAGFLSGYLREESFQNCIRYANACGAFAVSRLLCSTEYPTTRELNWYLEHGSPQEALRKDERLNHLHWATTRRQQPEQLLALAIDHRSQLAELANRLNVKHGKIERLKELAVQAAVNVARGRDGFGMLLDGTFGASALELASKENLWLASPVELPGSRPLEFDHMDSLATELTEWPTAVTAKCLCLYHPDDPPELRRAQERELLRLAAVCRRQRRELLLEIIASRHGPIEDGTVARVMSRMYEIGIYPDWWKLEAQSTAAAWQACADVIAREDDLCRGIVVLGMDAPLEQMIGSLRLAASAPRVRGFAVGRTIFGRAAEGFLSGQMSEEQAIADMSDRFAALVTAWNSK
ncbi:MAG TPA: 5-dehydro-2-deoxygluconokinase [Steroidobacteraceae bacterium]